MILEEKEKETPTEKMRRHRKRRKERKEEIEEEWRETWEEVKEEMELELKGGEILSKEMYYVIGGILANYPKGKKELPRYRCRAAQRIYSVYDSQEEVNDGIYLTKLVRCTKNNLGRLFRREWVSKILGGRSCYGKPH